MAGYKLISSDSHVFEPPDLWASRIDAKFRDQAPRMVRLEDSDWWICEGRKIMGMAAGSETGKRFEEGDRPVLTNVFENVRLGGYIPEERIKDLDLDGVYGDVLYPSVGLHLFRFIRNNELLTALFETYNDWLAEHCTAYPDRLKSIAMINLEDIQEGIKEMERTRKMGMSGAMITVYPPKERSYDSREYDSLWAAAQDLDMPLSLHLGTERPTTGTVTMHDKSQKGGQELASFADYKPSTFANGDYWLRMSLADMIFSGVFERYPKLIVGSVEHELAWIPHFLDRLDYTYTERAYRPEWYRFKSDMLPSDFFHRNVFCSFQEDAMGIRDRNVIGVDNLMWGSDYPHPESTFPKTREILDRIFEGVPEEERAKIVGGNAAVLYRFS